MISLRVEGMSCGHCVSAITQALKAADPAAVVRVLLPEHRVEVESSKLDAAQAIRVITEAGYTPTPG